MNAQNTKEVAKELFLKIKQDTTSHNMFAKNNPNLDLQSLEIKKQLSCDSFDEMQLGKAITKDLYESEYNKPSIIQSTVIPTIKSGKSIAVQSISGTGKTLAFVVGLLTRINKDEGPQAIILSPTRELNMQISSEIDKITKTNGIRTFLALRDKPVQNITEEILLGSPGSILSLVSRRLFNHKNIKILVLDESDALLNRDTMGSQTFRLLKAFENSQMVFISATYHDDIKQIIQTYKPDCELLFSDKNRIPADINLYYIEVNRSEKLDTLKKLYDLLTIGQLIVFASTKATVKYLEKILINDYHTVSILHGDMLHNERDEAVKRFACGITKILITTDVFSRGMDIPQVNLIVNYDLPFYKDMLNTDTYIHRIGRSGRFGRTGFVIDLIGNAKELKDYLDLQDNIQTISKLFCMHDLEEIAVEDGL